MAFNVDMMSDDQLTTLLSRITKIPDWQLRNTQSEREHKRIRQMQIHEELIKVEELKQQRLRRRRRIAKQEQQRKQTINPHQKYKEADDGFEL